MAYALDLALSQWRDGERRLREVEPDERAHLETVVEAVLDELRRRLGSRFEIHELSDLYGQGTDWAERIAQRASALGEAPAVIDAAFNRYSRQASDFAGGRTRYAGGDF